jgi:hypothetical protein
MTTGATPLPERTRYLVLLAIGPTVWMAHFLATYATLSAWCFKLGGREGSLSGLRVTIAAYTALALVAIGLVAASAYRRHRHGDEPPPHDMDSPEDRHRFLGFATLLLAGFSGLATAFVALSTLFFETCR